MSIEGNLIDAMDELDAAREKALEFDNTLLADDITIIIQKIEALLEEEQ